MMDVKFIKVNSSNINSVPIVDGQIIVLNDVASLYYDMAGKRYPAWGKSDGNVYGLVKLTDSYASSSGTAQEGVGVSSKGVYDLYSYVVSALSWKGLTMQDAGRSYTTLPTDARELSIDIYVTNGTGAYFFYSLHLSNCQGYYHMYRFNDGDSKANILVNFGQIVLSSAYIGTEDVTAKSGMSIRYR